MTLLIHSIILGVLLFGQVIMGFAPGVKTWKGVGGLFLICWVFSFLFIGALGLL